MVSSLSAKKVASELYNEALRVIEDVSAKSKKSLADFLNADDESVLDAAQVLIDRVDATMRTVSVDNVYFTDFTERYSMDSANNVIITISTRIRHEFRYKRVFTIARNENFVIELGKAFADTLYNLYLITSAKVNAADANKQLAEALVDCPFKFSFDVDFTTDAVVLGITDDSVVYNLTVEQGLKVGDLPLFKDSTSFDAFTRDYYIQTIIEGFAGVQTPVQLLKAKLRLFVDIYDAPFRRRADKMIRMSYHRKAENLDKVREGVGYLSKKVNINGEDVEIFALVGKAADGELSVVLSPFNIKTLDTVDYDVIADVKNMLAA